MGRLRHRLLGVWFGTWAFIAFRVQGHTTLKAEQFTKPSCKLKTGKHGKPLCFITDPQLKLRAELEVSGWTCNSEIWLFPCAYVYQSRIIQDMCQNNLSAYCAETHSSSSLWFIQLPSADLLQWHHSCETDVLSWYSLDLAPLTSAGLRFCRWATDVGAPRQTRSNLHQASAGNSSIRLITSVTYPFKS